MRRMVLVLVTAAALSACGGETLTNPTSSKEAAAAAAVEVAPAVVPAPAPWWSGHIGNFGAWHVENKAGHNATFTAYYTSFDDQTKVLGSVESGLVAPGKVFEGTFDKTCIQVDVTQGGAGDKPFLFAFIGADGRPFNPSSQPQKVDECQPRPTPDPTPSPKPTPDPEPTPKPTPPPPPPPPAFCYYEVDCGARGSTLGASTACSDSSKAAKCEAKGGVYGKWISQGKEHCRTGLPGISDASFQLTPGQSDEACLSKPR